MKKRFKAWALDLWWGTVAGGSTRAMWRNVGAKRERDRIIALLETEIWDSPEIAAPYVQHIVALIKGENE